MGWPAASRAPGSFTHEKSPEKPVHQIIDEMPLAARSIERIGGLRHARRNRFSRIILGRRRIEAGAFDVRVDHPLRFRRGLICEADVVADLVAEGEAAVRDAPETAEQYHALRAQRLQADRVGRPEQRARRQSAVSG